MTTNDAKRLILLPGLGADARLFEPQREAIPGLEVPTWLPHRDGESLPDYARRMVDSIDPREPYYLGGTSFGGMVALEMARHLNPTAIFLIASCRSGQAIAPHLRYFVRFSNVLPERVFEPDQGATPLFIGKFGRLSITQKRFFETMLVDASPSFVRWGIAAITEWDGAGELGVPIHHIHGSADDLILLGSVQPDRVVAGGGHLLNVTHADEVNAFIAERLV